MTISYQDDDEDDNMMIKKVVKRKKKNIKTIQLIIIRKIIVKIKS